ncbi:hypothetical protein AVEN_23417-1 [Araneus ventricosus]|uniref:Uncharacterized protein n=1 Tax=Araneus ventricosus TaxID=182803 RepID=A0A4Y2E6S7_ARAVE|nr:hypothetical protein AVEN_23417-1 [Araneus ventricosus]
MSVDEAIDRNRKNRDVVRAAVTNVIKSVEAELAKEVPDIELLQDKLNILVKREKDLQTLDETINGQIKLVELEKEVEHELEYTIRLLDARVKSGDLLINIGDAARAISGLTLTNENYDKAVEILKDRFVQKQAVISAYMNTVLSLQPVRRINDTLGLRNLYDEINNSIRSLESLGIDIDSYGNLLYPILDRCIPDELMLLFNRDQVVKGVKEPVVSDLINLLKGEMEARERSF